jgi:hypothetical protein
MMDMNVFSSIFSSVTIEACSDKWNLVGINPWYACLPSDGNGGVKITSLNDLYLILFPAVDSLVKIAALISAGMIFYMLIMMMYARGDTGKISTAVTGIRDSVVGLIVSLISVAIVQYIARSFSS